MADIVNCVIRHLRADSTIDSLAGDRIYSQAPVPVEGSALTLPDITVISDPGFEGEHKIIAKWRIRFLTRAARTSRSSLPPVENRLRALFHDATNYTLGASPDTAFCVISERLQTPGQAHDDDLGFWTSESVFEFTVLDEV